MTEGRTSVGEPDAEVERTSTTAGSTQATEHDEGTEHTQATERADTAHAEHADDAHDEHPAADDAGRTDAEDATAPAVGNDDAEPEPGETVAAATLPGEQDPADEGRHSASEGEEDWADAEDKAYKQELRKGLAFGTAGGLVLGAIVALLLGAFVYPGYLGGPGSPDDTANQVVSALTAKDANALTELSCKGPDGAPVSQLSPQVLQLIGGVRPAGPTTTYIDTEARTPVDLTLTAQGQTQDLPSELVIGQSQGSWCLKGLAQRQ